MQEFIPVLNARARTPTTKPARFKFKRRGIASRKAMRDARRWLAKKDTGHYGGWD